MTFLYFAYGSNLLRQRLLLQNPSAKFMAVGKLEDHTLSFSCLYRQPEELRWRGGVATLVEKPGDTVWGCVWRLDEEHKETLDRQEGAYRAKEVQVQEMKQNSVMYTCRTYELPERYMEPLDSDNAPSPMYMDIIIRGAIQNNLPEHYVKNLRDIPTNGRHEDLELYRNIIRQLEDQS